ncbi:MAG: hypothetical protein ABI972_05370 [Acidobacteriota bacterium]
MDPSNGSESSPISQQKLTSWKEIATYLGRSVTTVRRWEKSEGLPVHRHQHSDGATIYAYTAELEEWFKAREKASESGPEQPGAGGWVRKWGWVSALGGLAAIASALMFGLGARMTHGPDRNVKWALLSAEAGLEKTPALSPDGQQLAYSWNGTGGDEPFRLYVRPANGGAPKRLTESAGQDEFPQWSRDGKRLLYARHLGERVEVRTVDFQSGRDEKVLELSNAAFRGNHDLHWAVWGPDDRSVAVVDRTKADGPFAIYLVSLPSGSRRQLTFPGPTDLGDRDMAFSPDGREMAFVREGRGSEGDVFLVRLADGVVEQWTHEPGIINGIAFAPDGESILYGAPRKNAAHGLWRVGREGRIEAVPGLLGDASWPSLAVRGGRVRVAYALTRFPVNLRRWNAPFQGEPKVILASSLFDSSAALSPDGRRVAFRSNRSGQRQIWVASADGSGLRAVTHLDAVNVDSPRWSADGSQLVFTAGGQEKRSAYVLHPDTGELRELPDSGGSRVRASWSRDGRWTYFSSQRSGRYEIWKSRSDGSGSAVQLTRQGGFEAFEAPDGKEVYYTKPLPAKGVFAAGVEGGAERLVVDRVQVGLWAVARDAIWFVRLDPFGEIGRFRLDRKVEERMGQIRAREDLRTGFAVNWEGSTVVWCQARLVEDDIAMVEWGE